MSGASHLRLMPVILGFGVRQLVEIFDRKLVISWYPEKCSCKLLDSVILPAIHLLV